MTPRTYYVAPLAAFQSLSGVEWEAVAIGAGLRYFGHVNFCGAADLQATFESLAGVIVVGTLFHPTIPPAIATALQSLGVTGTDSAFAVIQKIASRLGGFTLKY